MQRTRLYELARYGVFRTDRMRYAPLAVARITFECRNAPCESSLVEMCDGSGRTYSSQEVPASGGVAEFAVKVGGAPGLHVIRA